MCPLTAGPAGTTACRLLGDTSGAYLQPSMDGPVNGVSLCLVCLFPWFHFRTLGWRWGLLPVAPTEFVYCPGVSLGRCLPMLELLVALKNTGHSMLWNRKLIFDNPWDSLLERCHSFPALLSMRCDTACPACWVVTALSSLTALPLPDQ